jgi:adenylate cyclase class IV
MWWPPSWRRASLPTVREVELKAIVGDEQATRRGIEAAGGVLMFAGRLEDRRYDDASGRLAARDIVLRLRTYRGAGGVVTSAHLDWKGPTGYDAGYKVRDEVSTPVGDPAVMARILDQLGFVIIREIDRVIAQYQLAGAIVRFERYPRMDVLVEVEGSPEAIEQAIRSMALPRSAFTSARLPEFVARYEARTGERAALCDRELAGEFRYRTADA